ncbi:preprotein translocase subunit SecY [bacterium]|nr:preprotein translocase subunit SecY [bacterium]MBU4310905.1 preprotein translocase subunit SecY [bacterium]MBU4561696.1 preprotein translocase subunit SecY [bacterium]MCG2676784.1 preprotein translocase subunit SecY [bacterium]
MLRAFRDAFKIPELKKRILFTFALLIVYRIGGHIPTPGIDGAALGQFFAEAKGTLLTYFDMFAGGALGRATVFALGIMPYITASIIFSLLVPIMPQLERLQKEGEAGRKKINQYTRYATVFICFIQGSTFAIWLQHLKSPAGVSVVPSPGPSFLLITVLTMTAGTIFIMWLGEQITERGIGNGISLIIFAGIVARLPQAGIQTAVQFKEGIISPMKLVFMLALLAVVIAGIVIITEGQRKIPVQYAKRIVGRRMYGGQSTFIPIRVNTPGVIPIIFASSILMFPATIAQFAGLKFMERIAVWLSPGHPLYSIFYAVMIIFFCYFYTAMIFNPIDLADNMKRYGGFIPGIRPGKSTSEYIERTLSRITLAGAIALAAIALFPDLVNTRLGISDLLAGFYGGTGMLIVVGVALDTVKQIENHLLMRHYEGFIKKGKIKARF